MMSVCISPRVSLAASDRPHSVLAVLLTDALPPSHFPTHKHTHTHRPQRDHPRSKQKRCRKKKTTKNEKRMSGTESINCRALPVLYTAGTKLKLLKSLIPGNFQLCSPAKVDLKIICMESHIQPISPPTLLLPPIPSRPSHRCIHTPTILPSALILSISV